MLYAGRTSLARVLHESPAILDAMGIYISHVTALWLRVSPRNQSLDLTRLDGLSSKTLNYATASHGEVMHEAMSVMRGLLDLPDGQTLPVHVTVGDVCARRCSRVVTAHLWSGFLPPHSFDVLSEGVFLATPEFCFLELARELDEIDLILVGSAMCGRYWIDRSEDGFSTHEPLTTRKRILDFLGGVPQKTLGLQKARAAANLILDNARSPMETVTAMILSLDRRRGGWGVARPKLNEPVYLTNGTAEIVGFDYFVIDLYWAAAKYGIEYNSWITHPDLGRDIMRQLTLLEDGITTQIITKAQLDDPNQTRLLVQTIDRLHGRVRRAGELDDGEAQAELRRRLLHSGKPYWAIPF